MNYHEQENRIQQNKIENIKIMYENQKVQFKFVVLNCTFLLLGNTHYAIYDNTFPILLLNQRQNLFLHLQQIRN